MPVRSTSTDESLIADPSDPLYARFETWRSIIGNLIEYFERIESMERSQAKEYQKLSKTLEVPFKTPEFATDGIATIWQGMRDKATQMSTFYSEQAGLIKAGVLSDLTRLKGDIKKHLQDLDKEGVQGSKKVGKKLDKFSDTTQSLGKWIPVAETNPTSLDSSHDPYVLWRQTKYRLYLVIDEENVLNEQLLALQNRCQHYERLIVQAIQKAIADYTEQLNKECKYNITVVNELNAISQKVPPEKEWKAFQAREHSLLKPDHKPRDPATATFPLSDHALTKPVLEATLARKSTLFKRRQSAFYVLSPSGFLHEYKDNDPVLYPDPTLSLKLADCDIGNPPSRSGKAGFTLRGKDAGKMVGRTHEYTFRTDSMDQAETWWSALSKFCGGASKNGGATESEDDEKSPVSQRSTMSQTSTPATRQNTEPPTSAESVAAEPVTAESAATEGPVASAATPATPTSPPTTEASSPSLSAAQAAVAKTSA